MVCFLVMILFSSHTFEGIIVMDFKNGFVFNSQILPRAQQLSIQSNQRFTNNENKLVIVTPCDLNSDALCLHKDGATPSKIPSEEFTRPTLSCLNKVSGGASLRGLSLAFHRILVFPTAT